MNAFFVDLSSGRQSEKVPVYLDWDQTHTLNATVSVGEMNDWNVTLVGRLGTGLPYTPQITSKTVYLRTNSNRKPSQSRVDLLADKTFTVAGLRLTAFLKVYNLFDTLNERYVYDDTGRATYTLVADQGTAQATDKLAATIPGVHPGERVVCRPELLFSAARSARRRVAGILEETRNETTRIEHENTNRGSSMGGGVCSGHTGRCCLGWCRGRQRSAGSSGSEGLCGQGDGINLSLNGRLCTAAGQATKGSLGSLPKTGAIEAQKDRKSYFMNGNKIATQLFNYGGIAPGYDALRAVNNVVWHNLDYVFQFCPIVGASVPDPRTPGKECISFPMACGTILRCAR